MLNNCFSGVGVKLLEIFVYTPESFNTNNLNKFFLAQNNLFKNSQTREYKFKLRFCTKNPVIVRFKDF